MHNTDPDTLVDLAKYIYNENGFLIGETTAAIITQAVKSKAPVVAVVSPDNGDRYPKWEAKIIGS